MRLRQLEVFRAVMLSGSVSAAARLLHVSQPVVSRVIRHAELSLGFPLFERTRGRLAPTPEAETLYRQVRRSWREIERVDALAENLRRGGAGFLRVAATPSLAAALLPDALAHLHREHPAMQCDLWAIHTPEIEDRLGALEIDVGVALEPPARVEITVAELAASEIFLATPIDWRHAGHPDRHRLAARPGITLAESTPLGDALSSVLEEANWQGVSRLRVQTYLMAGSLVERGIGYAFVDGFTASSLDPARVALYRIEPPVPVQLRLMRASGVAPSLGLSRLDQAVRDVAAARLAELPGRLQPRPLRLGPVP
ncbi:MAG: LysR family transcriptional regulator [Rhodocyclaceae bacterium]|nr:LysR family transcriptional regulator [Rhodocyclaceae bacterium]